MKENVPKQVTRSEALAALRGGSGEARELLGKLFAIWQEELGESLNGRAELIRRQAVFYLEAEFVDEVFAALDDGMEMALQENNMQLYEEFERMYKEAKDSEDHY